MEKKNVFIVYFSPAGSTRRVADVIEKKFLALGTEVFAFDLAYQTEEHHAEMEKVSLQAAKAHMPKRTVDTELCNQCRVCAEVCPTDAVGFTPFPVFGDSCVFCFTCMKKCPEQAINADFSGVWQRIKDRAEFFSEQPYSQIFIGDGR